MAPADARRLDLWPRATVAFLSVDWFIDRC